MKKKSNSGNLVFIYLFRQDLTTLQKNVAKDYLSHVMRKPVYAICEQQRRRSACASAQSDQRFVVRYLDSILSLLATAEISRLWLASVAEQACLSLTWSQTPKTGFLVTRLILNRVS